MIKHLAVFFIPGIYFLLLWLLPWERIPLADSMGPFAPSIIFDILIICLYFGAFKKNPFEKKFPVVRISVTALISALLGILCIFIATKTQMLSPFKYLEFPMIKLLFIAPFVEEALFRGVFIDMGEKTKLNRKVALVFNSFLFSFSHMPALWFLDEVFHGFIIFQIFYTFLLGLLCTLARFMSGGIGAAILVHFVFNLIFYISIIKGYFD